MLRKKDDIIKKIKETSFFYEAQKSWIIENINKLSSSQKQEILDLMNQGEKTIENISSKYDKERQIVYLKGLKRLDNDTKHAKQMIYGSLEKNEGGSHNPEKVLFQELNQM